MKIKVDQLEPESIPVNRLAERVKKAQGKDANSPVVISADKNVKYEAVVQVMDTLQRAGIQRVGLAVKSGVSSK